MNRAIDRSWNKIFFDYNINNHNFKQSPYPITAKDIKKSCQNFTQTGEK